MGLLGNFDFLPEDQQKREAARAGLLQFGASMLGGNGNFGQILGNGITAGAQGYHGTLAQQQQKALRDLQTKQLGLENQKLQAGIDEPMELAKIAAGAGGGLRPLGAPAATGGVAPVSSLPQVGQAKAAPAPAASETKPVDQYQYYLGLSQAYSSAGKMTAAKTAMEMADKLKPKLKEQQSRTVDGKRVLANVYEDGRTEQVQGFAPDAEKLNFQNTGGATVALDPYTGKPVNTIRNTQSPDSAASVGATIRGQNLTDARAREAAAAGDQGSITDSAILNAAARYNIDGTLPPMGMGKAAAAGRSAILNKAAELAGERGVSPTDQRIAQIGNKANTAALSKLQQQQTMVGAFERNFVKNADIVEEFSKKVDRTGIPIANKWINAGKRAVTGDPELVAFDAAVKAVSNEYAKIISGSMGNTATAQGEIAKVASLLNAAHTPEQVTAVVTLMRRETQNRMTGFDEEKSALRDQMGGKKPVAHGAKDLPQKPTATAYSDAEKERRYQEWKRSQAK